MEKVSSRSPTDPANNQISFAEKDENDNSQDSYSTNNDDDSEKQGCGQAQVPLLKWRPTSEHLPKAD